MFYKLDYSRGSYREFFWGNKPSQYPVIAITGAIIKLFRIRTPSSSDHPPVQSLHPFEVAESSVPAEVQARFAPLAAELARLGFIDPVFHRIPDAFHHTRIWFATYRHESGRACARIHHRVWDFTRPARDYLFPVFFTAFADGTWLLSTAGKKDTMEPPSFRVNRQFGAGAEPLWQSHVAALAQEAHKTIVPLDSPAAVREQAEAQQVALRDFHRKRGFFQRMSETERTALYKSAAPTAAGDDTAVVYGEMTRLNQSKPGWGGALTILLISLAVFLGAGKGQNWDWEFLLLLVPILFIHELGHYVAMRAFKYRNLRMFFIPLFGAAVTGKNFNVPGWKKALVSLAGPVPSILLAIVVGGAGLFLDKSALVHAAFVSLLINGFNLLPVLPLDGGWVMHATLFSRHYLLDTIFRAVAALVLIAGGLKYNLRMLPWLGGMSLFLLPVSYKLARVTAELQRRNLPPPAPDDPEIPRDTADVIIRELKLKFPTGVNAKDMAQHALTVFETINARPPSWPATLALLGLHGGTVILTIVFIFLFSVGSLGGHFGRTLSSLVNRPTRKVACNSTLIWRGVQTDLTQSNRTVIADLETRAAAEKVFIGFTNDLPAQASLRCFGSTLFLSLPAADEKAREHWFSQLEQHTTNLLVLPPGSSISVSLSATAPNEETAQKLGEALEGHFGISGGLHAAPPWLLEKQYSESERAGFLRARLTWNRLEGISGTTYTNVILQELRKARAKASRRGNKAEVERLVNAYAETDRRLSRQAVEALRLESPDRVDRELVDAWLKLPENRYTNREYQDALVALSPRLGTLALENGKPKAEQLQHAIRSGTSSRQGLLLDVDFVVFEQIAEGLPVLADWLCANGCEHLTYEVHLGYGALGEGEDEEQ